MIPEVLDFRITSVCNMNCSFCFGTKVNKRFNYGNLLSFFSFFKERGLRYVVITGGEPTLSDDFPKVLFMLRKLGYKIALSTNGTFWNEERTQRIVLDSCDWIALPIESTVEEEHNCMRQFSSNHQKLILSILPQIRQKAPNVKIKIGTVVNQKNILNVEGILGMLPIEPDSWKLFQLSRTSYNFDYYEKFKVEDGEFESLIRRIKAKYRNSNTNIFYSYENERNGRYLFLEPNGDLMVINNNEEQIIGNYCDSGEKIISEIERFVDINKTNRNFYNSFGEN